MEDLSKLSEQLNRIEKKQNEILELLNKLKEFERTNFRNIIEIIDPKQL